MKYYLYRHLNKESGAIFYIGVGTKKKLYTTEKAEYSRAFETSTRSSEWKEVFKNNGRIVEIMYESNSYDDVLEKEIFFIDLYGIENLVNKTKGGDRGYTYKKTDKQIKKTTDKLIKEVHKYSIKGEYIESFPSTTEAISTLNVCKNSLVKVLTFCKPTSGGYQWRYFKVPFIEDISSKKGIGRKNKQVKDILSGTVYESIREAARKCNISHTTLSRWLKDEKINTSNLRFVD